MTSYRVQFSNGRPAVTEAGDFGFVFNDSPFGEMPERNTPESALFAGIERGQELIRGGREQLMNQTDDVLWRNSVIDLAAKICALNQMTALDAARKHWVKK